MPSTQCFSKKRDFAALEKKNPEHYRLCKKRNNDWHVTNKSNEIKRCDIMKQRIISQDVCKSTLKMKQISKKRLVLW